MLVSVFHRKLIGMDALAAVPTTYPMMLKETVKPSGSAWVVNEDDPATLPVPLPVMIVKIEGRYTERDRKLWNFLVHAVWDALGKFPIHELDVAEVNRVFRECGGDHNTAWIWDSAKRLTRTVVEWQYTQGDTRYEGISSIFGAVLSNEMRTRGKLRFEIPALLVEIVKNPNRFSRVRLHFMMKLSGKYAVTLYEILESAANRRDPVLVVPLNELRQWLNVSAEKYPVWYDFKKWILDPAIKQINTDPVAAGFSVGMEPLRQSRAIYAVRFTVTKTDARTIIEHQRMGKATPVVMGMGTLTRWSPDDDTIEAARAAAPGWDVYGLLGEWKEWAAGQEKPPHNLSAAFIGFCARRGPYRA